LLKKDREKTTRHIIIMKITRNNRKLQKKQITLQNDNRIIKLLLTKYQEMTRNSKEVKENH